MPPPRSNVLTRALLAFLGGLALMGGIASTAIQVADCLQGFAATHGADPAGSGIPWFVLGPWLILPRLLE